MSPAKPGVSGKRGWIVPVGGAEDKVQIPQILQRFVELAGGPSARIAVVPTASRLEDTGQNYVEIFRGLGAGAATSLPFKDREDAGREDLLDELQQSTGVFLTGGDQLRISTILGGTMVARTIRRLAADGMVVGGTSAGAAVLSEHMISSGQTGSTPKAGLVTLVPGFGLTNRVIIDQHFRQRDRLGRLLTAIAYNPFAIGLGLDEDTAAFIDPDTVVHVVGKGAVTIVDARDLEHSGIVHVARGKPFSMIGIKLHVLTHGASFDLHNRVAEPPPVE